MSVPEALQDLLSVTDVSQITPVRVQNWQAAVRALGKDAAPDLKKWAQEAKDREPKEPT